MKDLKHLYRFETLLQEAHNELVQRALDDGRRALGYTCYYIPETLLNLEGCFSVRLRAPRSGSPDVATYYMTNRTCPFSRSLLERAVEGGFHFLSAFFGSETCATMDRAQEHLTLLNLIKNEQFFATHLDAPLKSDADSLKFYKSQLRLKVLEPLERTYGVDISDGAIQRAIEQHNRLCRIMGEIGALRKAENPAVTGYEFHVLNLVSQCCPQYLVLDMLEETLAELRRRAPDPKPSWRARVVLTGSEVDDPAFIKLLEDCGALVVAARFCYGSIPGREPIGRREGESAFDAVARHYLDTNQCPRFMSEEKVQGRRALVQKLFTEYQADGVIYESMKFCEFWGYERALASHVLANEMQIPCCTIEKEYTIGSMGQLRTRFQAFVESLEYKKLARAKEV